VGNRAAMSIRRMDEHHVGMRRAVYRPQTENWRRPMQAVTARTSLVTHPQLPAILPQTFD